MHAEPQLEAQLVRALHPSAAVRAGRWVLLACCLLAGFAFYWESAAAMARTWLRNDTYAHGLLVLPIVAYLCWRKREALHALPRQPAARGLCAVLLAGTLWLLGELSSTLSVAQFGAVAFAPALVWAVFGTATLRRLAFPLAFLFFAVPVGNFLLPWLMEMTADFTVAALRLSGVPVYREGMSFHIPTGAWSVVEACSGLRYLIASIMVGTLFAYLTFRSPRRRALFVGLSIAVPLAANWLRAYMIVMLGHLSGNRLAAGVDHLVYGWLFFGIVMLVMFGIGIRWREDLQADTPRAPLSQASPHRGGFALVLAAFVLMALWKPLAWALQVPDARALRIDSQPTLTGWRAQADTLPQWARPAKPAPAGQTLRFSSDGETLHLHFSYYRNQSQQSELISEAQVGETQSWQLLERKTVAAFADGPSVEQRAIRDARERWLAWRVYWVAGHWTANPYKAKTLMLWSRLSGQGDDAAIVLLYVQQHDERAPAQARLSTAFAELQPQLARAFAQAAER